MEFKKNQSRKNKSRSKMFSHAYRRPITNLKLSQYLKMRALFLGRYYRKITKVVVESILFEDSILTFIC